MQSKHNKHVAPYVNNMWNFQMRRGIKNQTQRQLKVVTVIVIVYYYLYGLSGGCSQLNMWLHFILYKHTQAEMQIMTSSVNLGFTLQQQTKHRQCDGVSLSAWCSCKNIKAHEMNYIGHTITGVQIQNLDLFMDLCTYICVLNIHFSDFLTFLH